MEVCVIGSSMVDLCAYCNGGLPRHGQTVFGSSFETNFGGKGANQSVQAARLGIRVCMGTKVGTDQYGRDYIRTFNEEGVIIEPYIRYSSTGASTGIACITVGNDGANQIVVIPGANSEYRPEEVDENAVIGAKVLICQNEIPHDTTMRALQVARQNGTVSIFNPAPAASASDLISYADIVCPNESELSELTGLPAGTVDEIKTAAAALLERGCKVVVATMGDKGACVVTGPSTASVIPTTSVDVLDTVGAGDSFIGALSAYLVRGDTLVEAVSRALQVATVSVTRKGAQKSYASLSELPETLRPRPINELDGAADTKASFRNRLFSHI
jgi:ribokinase